MNNFIEKSLPPEREPAESHPAPTARHDEPITAADLKTYAPVLELAQLQAERNLPNADFTRVIHFGLSGSAWGKIKAGNFNGSVERATSEVRRALAFAQAGRVIEAEGGVVLFDHVADAVAAVQIAQAARDEHRIVFIVGPSGSGKSATLAYLHQKFGGDFLHGHTDWTKSYMSELLDWANGLGLSASYRMVRQVQSAILNDLKSRPRPIFVDEGNYFSRDGLNFITTIANETRCPVIIGTLPNDLRRLNAEHNHETRQVIRRAVAIIQIPPVDSAMVQALHCARYSNLVLNGHAPQVAGLANKFHRIDTVVRVFEEVDPEDPADLVSAMQRVERMIKVEGIK